MDKIEEAGSGRSGLRASDVKRAVLVACVVAPILTVINQYDVLAAGMAPDWVKVALTFCVPFGVSLFSSWRAARDTSQA